MFLIGQTAQY